MSAKEPSAKPLSEKQRLKLEKFANKKEKQAQQQQTSVATKEKTPKNLAAAIVPPEDWIEETPEGHKKILKPLDDDFHKAYIPKVVESAWYSFWEQNGLFQPQLESNGALKPKGKYVIAIPPPNVS
jgi:valyl-tRNA synthetase